MSAAILAKKNLHNTNESKRTKEHADRNPGYGPEVELFPLCKRVCADGTKCRYSDKYRRFNRKTLKLKEGEDSAPETVFIYFKCFFFIW